MLIERQAPGTLPGTKPVRIDVLALAETKRALDLIRQHADDGHLLIHMSCESSGTDLRCGVRVFARASPIVLSVESYR